MRGLALLMALSILGSGSPGHATEYFVVGQGGATGDCIMEWRLDWGSETPEPAQVDGRLSARQSCCDRGGAGVTKNDTCDLDPRPNVCRFRVGMCFCVGNPTMTGSDANVPQCFGLDSQALDANGVPIGAVLPGSSIGRWCGAGRRPPTQFRIGPPTRRTDYDLSGFPLDPSDLSWNDLNNNWADSQAGKWKFKSNEAEQGNMTRLRDSAVLGAIPGVGTLTVSSPSRDAKDFIVTFDSDASFTSLPISRPPAHRFSSGVVNPAGYPVFPAYPDSSYACSNLVDVYVALGSTAAGTVKKGKITRKPVRAYFPRSGTTEDAFGQYEIDRSGDRLSLTCLPGTEAACHD